MKSIDFDKLKQIFLKQINTLLDMFAENKSIFVQKNRLFFFKISKIYTFRTAFIFLLQRQKKASIPSYQRPLSAFLLFS